MKTMTLPELSMFIKKQELELRERTEKEREEGERPLVAGRGMAV